MIRFAVGLIFVAFVFLAIFTLIDGKLKNDTDATTLGLGIGVVCILPAALLIPPGWRAMSRKEKRDLFRSGVFIAGFLAVPIIPSALNTSLSGFSAGSELAKRFNAAAMNNIIMIAVLIGIIWGRVVRNRPLPLVFFSFLGIAIVISVLSLLFVQPAKIALIDQMQSEINATSTKQMVFLSKTKQADTVKQLAYLCQCPKQYKGGRLTHISNKVFVIYVGSTEMGSYQQDLDPSIAASSADIPTAIVCVENSKQTIETCTYSGPAGSFSRHRTKTDLHSYLIDVETAKLVASNVIEGTMPETCPVETASSGDIDGQPNRKTFADWVKATLTNQ